MAPPTPQKLRVLLVASDPGDALLLREMVTQEPGSRFEVAAETARLDEAISLMVAGTMDVVLLDLALQDSRGIETFTRAHEEAPDVPIIVLSGVDDEEFALQTVHLGAQEYLAKGRLDQHLLHRALRYAIERARAERELAQERYLFHTLLDNIPDRIYFKDEQSRFMLVNKGMIQLFGVETPEEMYGKTDADFFKTEHAEEALADEQLVMRTGEPIYGKVEKEIVVSGRRSWCLTSKLPLRDRRGRIIGTCGISREITAIKTLEEELSTERNLLRSLINNIPDLIYLKDGEGRYLLDNLAHMRWVGASHQSDVIGRTVFDFFSDETAAGFHQGDVDVMQSGRPLLNHEEKIYDPDGGVRWVQTSKIPWLDEDGTTVGLVCITRDITAQKMAEARLKQANVELAASREELLGAVQNLQVAHHELRAVQLQLIEAEKMKSIGRLAAGVAHEVKNPLAILAMGIEFLSTQNFTDDTTPLILKEMADAVSRADGVIRGLLDFSAPKQMEVAPEDLNAIIANALNLVRGEIKGALKIERDLQKNLPLLRLDARKIGQVFVNLLTNAIHSIEGPGTLAVRTYSKQLTGVGANIGDSRSESFRVGETIVVAEIDDSGHGIPDDKLAKIFEPFFTTKPTGKGSGLGLSVCKTIIDLHGATIDLRNLPDGGVRATLMFQV